MAIKVKAKETLFHVGLYAGTYRYVLAADLYSQLSSAKVITEAALRSGLSKGVMNAAWEAIGDVISAWATEGHSVAIPGLGSMRFGLNAKSVGSVDEVSSGLITTRKVIFAPNSTIKNELKNTSISITCYDRNGQVIKTVSSQDAGEVEENDTTNNGSEQQGSGSSTQQGGSSTEQGGSSTEQGGGNTSGDDGMGD
ncbi:MAG: DNA-binding protein [Bacteroidaceae bacterium]|nr:DNA-binding protein [Bacteroidaceae bacterium]